MDRRDGLFETIERLVLRHSPSGYEYEVDEALIESFRAAGADPRLDAAGNLIVRIAGRGGGSIAITAHKDEIGAVVTAVEPEGRVRVRKLGGSYPWIYGEGVVDLLGEHETVSGILSFGSRHVSHASPQFAHRETAPLRWSDVWIETKRTPEALEAAGLRPGARMVVGRHRKAPVRLGEYIASYALDDKAALAVMLELCRRVKDPWPDVHLVASAKEEVGSMGALYFARQHALDALIALEICPVAPEYTVKPGPDPVLVAEDGLGLYDEGLNRRLRRAAMTAGVAVQTAVLNGFGSDGSGAMKQGQVPAAACLCFPTENTHGFEIAHLDALENCTRILEAACLEDFRHG